MQDIRGTIANLTKTAAKSSGDFLKSTKLSMSLSSEEGNLKELQLELGRKVHEIYQYGGSLGKFFDEKYLEIEACERKIAELREQISEIKGTKQCVKCGKSLNRDAEFCQKCGIRVELSGTACVEQTQGQMQPDFFEAAPQTAAVPSAAPATPNVSQAPIPAPITPSSPPPVLTTRTCRVCNSENENGTKFCLTCGRILD